MRRPIAVTALAAFLLLPAGAEAPFRDTQPKPSCARAYDQAKHAHFTRRVYQREKISKSARSRLSHLRRCQYTLAARRAALRFERRWQRWRRTVGIWHIKFRKLKPTPGEIAWLGSTSRCESGGNPRSIGGGGIFRGKYQFMFSTWRSIGGSGDPAALSEREQDYRALRLLRRDGPRHWPSCG